MRLRLVSLVALAALVAAPSGSAQEPLRTVRGDGFSMQVPASWSLLTNVGSLKLMATSRERVAGFYPNANVLATAPTPGSLTNMRLELMRRLRSSGIRVTTLRIRTVRLPAGTAIELRYNGTMAGRRLAWLAYSLQTSARAYVLTFTAAAGAFAPSAPLFRTMARSFRMR